MAGRSTRFGLSALIIAVLTFILCVTVEVEAKTNKPVKKSSWFASASSNAPAQPGEYRLHIAVPAHGLIRSIITHVYVHARMAEEVADKDEFADLVTKRKVGFPCHIS
jgi:hypothetical protein